MAKKCVFYCLLLNQLNGCFGCGFQFPEVPMSGSEPDCSEIFNAHPEEASIFLDPDATKDVLERAKMSIISHYSEYVSFVTKLHLFLKYKSRFLFFFQSHFLVITTSTTAHKLKLSQRTKPIIKYLESFTSVLKR